MIGKIQFRAGQDIKTLAPDGNVIVYAPDWVKEALAELSKKFIGAKFSFGNSDKGFVIVKDLSLVKLIAIARNEKGIRRVK